MATTTTKKRKTRSSAELIACYQQKVDNAMKTVQKYKAKIQRLNKLGNKAKYKDAAKSIMNMTSEQLDAFNAWVAEQQKGE